MIIPKENEKDLAEVPDNVKTGLKIVPVSNVGEVLEGRAGAPAGSHRLDRAGSAGGAAGVGRWTRAIPTRWSRINDSERGPGRTPSGPFFLADLWQKPLNSAVFRLDRGASRAPKVRLPGAESREKEPSP